MTDPAEAYRTAKALRAANAKIIEDSQTRAASLPEEAETKFVAIIEAMKQSLPSGLTMNAQLGPGGLLGKRGVKSIFFHLLEDEKNVADGAFSCRDDGQVIMQGMPPHMDKRPGKEYGAVPLSAFDEKKAIDVLSKIITQYLV